MLMCVSMLDENITDPVIRGLVGKVKSFCFFCAK